MSMVAAILARLRADDRHDADRPADRGVDGAGRRRSAALLAYRLPFLNSIGADDLGRAQRQPADRHSAVHPARRTAAAQRHRRPHVRRDCRPGSARLPGGLLHTNIGCCALFAATSGSSVATAATIGTVALPSLQQRGYPMPQVAGLAGRGRHAGHPDPAVDQHDHLRLADRTIRSASCSSPASCPGLLLTRCVHGLRAASTR